MTARKGKKPSYEQGVEALDALIGRLSEGKLTLEEAMKTYEEGAALLSELTAMLDAHQRRIEQLDPETGELTALAPLSEKTEDQDREDER